MLKAGLPDSVLCKDEVIEEKKSVVQRQRVRSFSPVARKGKNNAFGRCLSEKKPRSQSLSPSLVKLRKFSVQKIPATGSLHTCGSETRKIENITNIDYDIKIENVAEKEIALPQCVVSKIMRALTTKKREFIKMRKHVMSQQKTLLEQYAAVKDMETQAGIKDNSNEIRVLTVQGWPAHDILMLLHDDLDMSIGPQILRNLHAQLIPIPEDVVSICAEVMARRIDILNLLKERSRHERSSFQTNLEWKAKFHEFEEDTEKLHRMVAGAAENLKAKIIYALKIAKVSWIDRGTLIQNIERLKKENLVLHNTIEELNKTPNVEVKDEVDASSHEAVCVELAKEKAARESLKEVVLTAENMLRVARSRITNLERLLKENKAELDATKKKQKDLEQLQRHRDSSFDVKSKKLIEVSKTGEITIETLSRQRDALELRVKELREQAEIAEKRSEKLLMEEKARVDSLKVKLANQEKNNYATKERVIELETKVVELEQQKELISKHSQYLTDMDRTLQYLPAKEHDPTEKETMLWRELQMARLAVSQADEKLRESRADKENFLDTLNRVAITQGNEACKDKMAMELLDREERIINLQRIIEKQRHHEKQLQQSVLDYENQLWTLRLEVNRLRNYDCYVKDVPCQDLHTEILDLQMQVESLTRERNALVTSAASRALMLERHERAEELFTRMTRTRRELAALISGQTDPPSIDETERAQATRSLSSVCMQASNTWSALRAERTRVLCLESAVLSQNLQLERDSRIRTQLERHRAILERELLRAPYRALPDIGITQS